MKGELLELAKDIASIHNSCIDCDFFASEVLAQSDSVGIRHCGVHICKMDSTKVCDDCANCCEDTICVLNDSKACTVCMNCADL